MAKLDLKDRKLLYELDCNSRQTIQQLSRKIKLSKDGIKYRIKRLQHEGIIKYFYAVINNGKLGFINFRLFLKLYNLSPEKEKEIINYLLKNENLTWLVQVDGEWDLNTWFMYKSIKEMNDFFQKLLEKYGNYIGKREFGVYTEINYYNRVYFLQNKKNNHEMIITSLSDKARLSESDEKIIKILSKNARISIVEISKKTGLTSKTIIKKIRQLKKDKVILGYRTVFDLEKLGYNYYKIHISTFNCSQKQLTSLKQYLYEHPNVVYLDFVLGGYDLEFEVQIENKNRLRDLLLDIRKQFANIIKDYTILHYFKEHRLEFLP